MTEVIVAESFDGGYQYHKALHGEKVALCGKPLLQSVKELPIETWGTGEGRYCPVCAVLRSVGAEEVTA